jgi:hypothetical protein
LDAVVEMRDQDFRRLDTWIDGAVLVVDQFHDDDVVGLVELRTSTPALGDEALRGRVGVRDGDAPHRLHCVLHVIR